ncbi:MAG: hypothetical protein RIB59_07480, partial [Rhodospirillales bacterium]
MGRLRKNFDQRSSALQVWVVAEKNRWLTAKDFAPLTGRTIRQAQRIIKNAVEGKPWEGNLLVGRITRGRGGARGCHYQVYLPSLPAELQQRWTDRHDEPETGESDRNKLFEDTSDSNYRWRYELIRPALILPARSKERADAIRAIAARKHMKPDGSYRKVSPDTLRRWLASYEANGYAGLKRKKRQDRGSSRVFISRRWDSAVPFDDATKQRIKDDLLSGVNGRWAKNTSFGWHKIAWDSSLDLENLTIEAGYNPGRNRLRPLCRLPRSFVEQGRKYRAVAIYNMDHKQYDDKSRPRVQRRPPENPMEVVVGDVHHMDVLLSRPDGSTFTPKIVAWLDWATSRIFTCPVFLKKGEGIRQEHVVEAFIAMVKDKRWGMPQTLYLDNGTEYYWTDLINNAQKLNDQIRIENLDTNKTIKQKLKARRSSIINAKPYNASAKVIEGTFGFLERIIFSTFPGHIGGNRTNKKTANVGKLPA